MLQDIRAKGAIKWKHAMHLVRPLVQGKSILAEGIVPVRVTAYRDSLLEIRHGAWPWEKVDAWRKDLHQEFEAAFAKTTLPERPDYERANAFLIHASRSMSEEGRKG